jgi:hypothetical protein
MHSQCYSADRSGSSWQRPSGEGQDDASPSHCHSYHLHLLRAAYVLGCRLPSRSSTSLGPVAHDDPDGRAAVTLRDALN